VAEILAGVLRCSLPCFGHERFVQGGFQQSATGADSRGELPFQFVAHGHKFVYFGDDAVLFVTK
jgi:hypothetical protein